MQIPVCEIFWQRFFISWINGAIFYLHDVNFWLSFFGPSFRYNLVTIGVLEFVVVIDVYAQPTREKIKFYRTASYTILNEPGFLFGVWMPFLYFPPFAVFTLA